MRLQNLRVSKDFKRVIQQYPTRCMKSTKFTDTIYGDFVSTFSVGNSDSNKHFTEGDTRYFSLVVEPMAQTDNTT